MTPSLDDLVARVGAASAGRRRWLVGLAGAPGAGKTTLAASLAAALPASLAAAVVPMDGFHLADVTLDALGRRDRKGAPDTFDPDGYAALLRRLREPTGRSVYAPGFERDLEQPLAAAVTVPDAARVVVTEGNYLLLDDEPWPAVRAALDEVWFVETDEALRLERLTARHVAFGKTPDSARDWVAAVDQPNADRVAVTRERAALVVRV